MYTNVESRSATLTIFILSRKENRTEADERPPSHSLGACPYQNKAALVPSDDYGRSGCQEVAYQNRSILLPGAVLALQALSVLRPHGPQTTPSSPPRVASSPQRSVFTRTASSPRRETSSRSR